MKIRSSIINKIPSLALAMTLMVFSISCASKSKECKLAMNHESQVAAFKSSDGWNKIDGRFKMAWVDAMTSGNSNKSFDCLMKTESKPTGIQKNQLQEAGFTYRSVIGNILTGSLVAKDLPEVTKLSFVKVIELAVPVTPK